MIPIRDIERVYEILDREIAYIEVSSADAYRKKKGIERWMFVREQFRQVCLALAHKEGFFDKLETTNIPQL